MKIKLPGTSGPLTLEADDIKSVSAGVVGQSVIVTDDGQHLTVNGEPADIEKQIHAARTKTRHEAPRTTRTSKPAKGK